MLELGGVSEVLRIDDAGGTTAWRVHATWYEKHRCSAALHRTPSPRGEGTRGGAVLTTSSSFCPSTAEYNSRRKSNATRMHSAQCCATCTQCPLAGGTPDTACIVRSTDVWLPCGRRPPTRSPPFAACTCVRGLPRHPGVRRRRPSQRPAACPAPAWRRRRVSADHRRLLTLVPAGRVGVSPPLPLPRRRPFPGAGASHTHPRLAPLPPRPPPPDGPPWRLCCTRIIWS